MIPQAEKGAFGRLYKEFRARLGLTQAEVERQTGLSRRNQRRWEKGEVLPSWDKLQQLVWLAEKHDHYHHLFDLAPKTHTRSYRLLTHDTKGVLARVSQRLYDHDGDVRRAEIQTYRDRRNAELKITVSFEHSPEDILAELFSLDFVQTAQELDRAGSILAELPSPS